MIGATDLGARKLIEFVREIYDRTGCGIVMCGTKVLREEMERGRQAMVYDQFRRRGMIDLVLPDAPPKSDITKIAKAFGLGEPDAAAWEIIRDMLATSGIGKYIRYLQCAHGMAVSQNKPLAWDHYIQASEKIAALNTKKRTR